MCNNAQVTIATAMTKLKDGEKLTMKTNDSSTTCSDKECTFTQAGGTISGIPITVSKDNTIKVTISYSDTNGGDCYTVEGAAIWVIPNTSTRAPQALWNGIRISRDINSPRRIEALRGSPIIWRSLTGSRVIRKTREKTSSRHGLTPGIREGNNRGPYTR